MSKVIVIGTSHISKKSIREVRKIIKKEKPDCVAVELCPKRYYALQSRIIKPTLKFGLMVWFFSYLQKKLGEKIGIFPGSEMLSAIESARQINARIVLIDEDIENILNNLKRIPIKEKIKILFSIFLTPFEKLQINEKTVNEVLKRMKKNTPCLYRTLVEERNKYMVRWIGKLKKEFKKIVVVVGMGHKEGIEKLLRRRRL